LGFASNSLSFLLRPAARSFWERNKLKACCNNNKKYEAVSRQKANSLNYVGRWSRNRMLREESVEFSKD
jgi:hypothetical protein